MQVILIFYLCESYGFAFCQMNNWECWHFSRIFEQNTLTRFEPLHKIIRSASSVIVAAFVVFYCLLSVTNNRRQQLRIRMPYSYFLWIELKLKCVICSLKTRINSHCCCFSSRMRMNGETKNKDDKSENEKIVHHVH